MNLLRSVPFVILLAIASGCGDGTASTTDAATTMDASAELDTGAAPDAGSDLDTGSAADSGAADDTGITTDSGGGTVDDTGVNGDAGPLCEGSMRGSCAGGLECDCCPAGGPLEHCTCSTPCTSAADCTDPARPVCQQASAASAGFCAPSTFTCCWLCL